MDLKASQNSVPSYQFFKQPSLLWKGVLSLRLAVFVDEMKVPLELEEDEHDRNAIHLCVMDQKKTIATLRLVDDSNECGDGRTGTKKSKVIKLGRLAVHNDYRRRGIGRQMIQLAMTHCHQLGYSRIELASQTYITSFYESSGFQKEGDIFEDAGIPHIKMYLRLK